MPLSVTADTVELDFAGTLTGSPAKRFAIEAERRRLSPAQLAASILETVIADDLFAALLDD